MKFNPELEGLRGLAAALVILVHTTAWVPGAGFVGVELFFVLSGYLTARVAMTRGIGWTEFMAARMRRIWPLLLVFSLVCFIGFSTPERPYWEALGAAMFLESPRFATGAVSYVSHTWTLSVEMASYVLIGLLALTRDRLQIALGAVVCILLSVWSWEAMRAAGYLQAAYGLPVPRASTLFLGVILACLPTLSATVARWITPLALALLMMIALGLMGPAGAVKNVISLLAVAAVAGLLVAPFAPLRSGVMRVLGRFSYGLYLWHFPVAMLLRDLQGLPLLLITLLISVPLSILTYYLVEQPFRRPRPEGGRAIRVLRTASADTA